MSLGTNYNYEMIENVPRLKREYRFLPCNLYKLYSRLYPGNILMIEIKNLYSGLGSAIILPRQIDCLAGWMAGWMASCLAPRRRLGGDSAATRRRLGGGSAAARLQLGGGGSAAARRRLGGDSAAARRRLGGGWAAARLRFRVSGFGCRF